MNPSQILGLRTAIYKVENLNEAKEWYSKAFEQNQYFDESFYVGFNIGEYELALFPNEEKRHDEIEQYFWLLGLRGFLGKHHWIDLQYLF
jgi:hypothetical protein